MASFASERGRKTTNTNGDTAKTITIAGDSRATETASYQRFRTHFAAALLEFNRNVDAWLRGMTWPQVRALRELCADEQVPFDPADYNRLDTGQFVGWIGGRGYAKPRSSGRSVYVGVDPAGVVTGITGERVNRHSIV